MTTPTNIRRGAVIAFIAAAALLFIVDASGNSGQLVSFLRDPMTAVSTWLSPSADALADRLSGPASIQEALTQIETLQQRVDELERENELLRENEGEYQLLLSLFDYATESPLNKRVIAGVIGRDSSPLFQSIVIDKGTRDGVQVGMPVDSQRGLVGQVFRTTADSALVLLISDSSSSIPGRLSDSRATGLIHGGGEGGTLIMDWIPLEAEIEAGDVALTSGLVGEFDQGVLVGRFPKGLVVGRVASIERRDAEILQRAVIQTDVNFDDLELVFVIIDFPKEDLTPFENPLGDQ